MSDAFERFLTSALAADQREPDRRFVARVQARIALHAHLCAQRRDMLRQLVTQIIGLGGVAGGLLWLGRAGAVSRFFADWPWLALCILLSIFGLLLLLFSSEKVEGTPAKVSL
jgi:cytochrome bd-type quinol oxidase subunit 2